MQTSEKIIEQRRPVLSGRVRIAIGGGLLVLLVTAGVWLNASAQGPNQPAPPKELMGTSVVTITVDGMPGVVAKELLTLSPGGGQVAAFNYLASPVSYFVGQTITAGPLHGNWEWVHGSDTLVQGVGVLYLFDETKSVFGHETVKWWVTGIREDGAFIGRWEATASDLNGNVIMQMQGDSVGQRLTETTPVN